MLKTAKVLLELTFIALLSIASLKSSYGQKEINLTAGLGLPELLNIGIRGQLNQYVCGISVGTVLSPGEGEKIYSVCGDLFYHFGKVNELSKRRVWYLRSGLNYLRDKLNSSDIGDRYTFLNLRFGRDLNLSKKIGIQIDGGFLILLSEKRIPESTIGSHSGGQNPMAPPISLGLGLTIFLQL
jgi:hypothetical protein